MDWRTRLSILIGSLWERWIRAVRVRRIRLACVRALFLRLTAGSLRLLDTRRFLWRCTVGFRDRHRQE